MLHARRIMCLREFRFRGWNIDLVYTLHYFFGERRNHLLENSPISQICCASLKLRVIRKKNLQYFLVHFLSPVLQIILRASVQWILLLYIRLDPESGIELQRPYAPLKM